jgi:hypothetical protein
MKCGHRTVDATSSNEGEHMSAQIIVVEKAKTPMPKYLKL